MIQLTKDQLPDLYNMKNLEYILRTNNKTYTVSQKDIENTAWVYQWYEVNLVSISGIHFLQKWNMM